MAGGMESFGRFAKTFKPGTIIFSEFEPGDNFYLIQSGRVHLVKIMGEIEKTLDIIGPSDMFGEMAILENSPRSATAIAVDEVKVLEFNARNFEVLLLGNPQIALRLLRMFCKRIYDAKRRFMTLVLDDPQAKIADVFLTFDETQPNIDKTTERREFEATVDNIAQWAGMGVKEAGEILSRFVSQRRIEIHANRIAVKNINDFIRFVSSRRNKL
ncbi:MAG: cyclic nucleotide-binding domain-containing protein [Treponema sp.]|jgi:CRP-like cAMP-binding protein|nr:cyclic nucleotide-binding domain-containing protein [Treponema sp.]